LKSIGHNEGEGEWEELKGRCINFGLKKWSMSVLDLHGSEQSVVTGCCEHGNEHRSSEDFLIIFMSIISSNKILCHMIAYKVRR
jgi:hypothetical protein